MSFDQSFIYVCIQVITMHMTIRILVTIYRGSIISHYYIHIEVYSCCTIHFIKGWGWIFLSFSSVSGITLRTLSNIFPALEIFKTCHIWSRLHLVLFEYRNLKHICNITRKSLTDRKYKHFCVTSLTLVIFLYLGKYQRQRIGGHVLDKLCYALVSVHCQSVHRIYSFEQ